MRLTLAVLVTLALLAGLLAWRVAQGPVSIDFLIPYISEALTIPRLGIKAEMADVVLAWSEREQALRLRLRDVRYRVEDERVALTVPTIDMGLSGPSLLRGVVAPRFLHVSGIEARLVRDRQGRFIFGLPADDEAGDAPSDTPPPEPAATEEDQPERVVQTMFASIFDILSRPPDPDDSFGQIETISILADRLIIEDWKLDQRWVVPGAQMVARRGEGHAFASASGALDFRGKHVQVNVDADYSAESRSARVVLKFDQVEPSDFADVVPELAPLAHLRAPVAGSLELTVTEDGQQLDLGFYLEAGAGKIDAPDLLAAPLDLTEARFRGLIEAATGELHLAEASLQFADDFRLSFGGTVTRSPQNEYGLAVKGQFFDLPTNSLELYWPTTMAKNAREWVTSRIREGKVTAGRFTADLVHEMLDGVVPIPREAFQLDFAFDGLELDYLPPMQKLVAVKGSATLNADELDLTVESGKVGSLQVGSGRVRILGLQAGEQQADITGATTGTSRDVLALIDQKPLGFPSKLGIKPAGVGGNAAVKFRLRFPLVNALQVDDIIVDADADLAGLSMPKLLNRYDLTNGDLKLKVDTKGLEAGGKAAINDVPLQIGWRQEFNARVAIPARYSLKGRVDEAQRKALGYPLAPYIDGPADATIQIEERRGGETVIGGEFDLTDAVIDLAEAHLNKPTGEALKGRVLIRTKTGQPVQFDTIELNGPEMALIAKAVLPPGGGWAAEISQFRRGANSASGRIVFTAAGDAQIELRGKRYDLQPFMEDIFDDGGEPGQPKPRLVLDLRLDEAVIGKDLEMRNLQVNVERKPERLEYVSITGGFATTGGMTLTIAPQLDGRALNLQADNAGALLHFFGITDMQGGTMRIVGRFDDTQRTQPLTGKMDVRNVRAVKAPFLARLFGAGSFTGLSSLLSGEGILFESGEVPFEQKDGVLTLQPSRFQGPQLGLTFEGTVNQKTDHISVSGTAVPAFVLNTILGRIPVLGDLFVGDGIIGVNFAVSGPRDDPQFTVNPLSALAPGFLRRIFQAPQEKAPAEDRPKPAENKPAEEAPQPSPLSGGTANTP